MNRIDARDAFSGLHPGPCYLFFAFVIVFTVVFMHPAVLALSFVCASAYAFWLGRGKALRFTLAFLLPVMLLAAVLNPAFNHRGATILFYLFTGNPVTLESLIYGVAGALMIGAVIQWFYCYNAVMSSDKFLWLFGRAIPALALVISMTLRLIPRYTAQARRVAAAQRGLGHDVASGNLVARVRSGLGILSTLTTWALENAVDTADSMNSRGYGTGSRTAYSNYRLERRDLGVTAVLALTALCCVSLVFFGGARVAFFPTFVLDGDLLGSSWMGGALLCVLWAVLAFFPLALDIWEELKWRSLHSKI
jgi:energy-coupling factor transport system permease protein